VAWRHAAVAAALLAGLSGQSLAADIYLEEELRIPLPTADSHGLEALLVRPKESGRYSLALISHGSPRSPAGRTEMTPWAMLPQAIEFARRGWAAVVVLRRGYGGSGGGWAETYGPCANPDYVAAGSAGAADLNAAISFLGGRPDVDTSRMIAVGVSAGGFATVALTADPPPGLVAAISFAGGRGSARCATAKFATKNNSLRPFAVLAGGHESPCCGSMLKTIISSDPSWRGNSEKGSQAVGPRSSSSARPPLAATDTNCFRRPAPPNGAGRSTRFCGTKVWPCGQRFCRRLSSPHSQRLRYCRRTAGRRSKAI